MGISEYDESALLTEVVPDVTASRVYFLHYNKVKTFDLNTLALVGNIDVPYEPGRSFSNRTLPNLIRVGADRIAVAKGPNIFLFRTAILH